MADEARKQLLLRKRELILKGSQARKKPSAIESIGKFFQAQFPEVVEEATGRSAGLVPKELTEIGAKIKEKITAKAPSFLKRGLETAVETAAETVRGGVLSAVVPGGRTTIEKPITAATIGSIVAPGTRVPTIAGLGSRLAVQQIVPPEVSPVPGIVAEVVGGLTTAGIRSLFRTAKLGNKKQVLDSVKTALDEATTARKKLSTDITTVMDSAVGDKPINVGKVSEALANVPGNVQSKILKDAKLFNIELLPDGSIKPDTRNTWRLRQALDDFLTSKDFREATKAAKQVILKARRGIADILADVDPKIKTVMKNFSDFMDSFEPVKKILSDSKGNPIANKIITASKKSGEPAQKIALEKFSENFKKTKDALKSATGFLKGEAVKKGVKRGIIGVGLGALAAKGAKGAREFFKGGE